MNKKTLIKLGVFLVLVGVIIWVGVNYRDQFTAQHLEQLVSRFGIWAPVIFMLLYVVAVVLFLPGAALTIAGGLIFGPVLGTVYNISAAVIGSTIAFLVARYLASDWVAQRAGGKLKQLIEGVEQEGWKFVAFVRLVPLFPFNLLNYALGLTRIRLLAYIVASAVFMLPGTIAYTYVGSLGQAAIAGKPKELVTKIFIAIGLLVLVGAIPYMLKKVRKGKQQNNEQQ